MIWLKENDCFLGYVPILKKHYNETSIREMSEYNCYTAWSLLSELVMQIQGIEYSYWAGFSKANHYNIKVKKLADIETCFNFECFTSAYDNQKMQIYIKQISEVFQNLTLYKVKEVSEDTLKEDILQAKQLLSKLGSYKILSEIDNELSTFIQSAEITSTNLSKLKRMIATSGYHLTTLFDDITKPLSKKIYAKRKTEAIFDWKE